MQTSADRDAAIRLSSHEREQQRQNIVWMLGELSKQVDVLTLQQARDTEFVARLQSQITELRCRHSALLDSVADHQGASFIGRLLWMLRGR